MQRALFSLDTWSSGGLIARLALSISLLSAPLGCSDSASASPTGGGGTVTPVGASAKAESGPAAPIDAEGDACKARFKEIEAADDLPGAPAFEKNRIEILGRARGEPMFFVREPQPTPDADLAPPVLASKRGFEKGRPGGRVHSLLARYKRDPRALRSLLLREGYAFFDEPADALALATSVHLSDLFDEPEIWIQRGRDVRKLRREEKRKEIAYRYIDGPSEGRAADLLFGDRVAVTEDALRSPMHRDLRALADEIGFDRMRIKRRTEGAILADLRFGERWASAVITSEGAALELGCLAEQKAAREEITQVREATAPRRRALATMHDVITSQVTAAIRFDRPEGEKTADRDGILRPIWATAYFQGRQAFSFEGTTFQVFDANGLPWPPQVCVDFVLDTFERSSGTWYSPRGERPARTQGRVDFNEVGIQNRRGVLAFADFAEKQPELFQVRRFQGAERIPFGERSKFFAFLVEHAGELQMGDVTAIHGMKRDDRIHQHAILVEWTDPITGFPYGLADQMKKPRRRTWEGIMAEAPKRSLLYRVRPTAELFQRVAGS